MLVVFSDDAEPLSRLLLRLLTGLPTCSPTWLGKNMQWGTSSSQRHLAPLWIKVFCLFFSLRACLCYLIVGNLCWPRGAGKHHRRRKVRSSATAKRERAFWSSPVAMETTFTQTVLVARRQELQGVQWINWQGFWNAQYPTRTRSLGKRSNWSPICFYSRMFTEKSTQPPDRSSSAPVFAAWLMVCKWLWYFFVHV